ncbi:MAG: hypothetical protein AAFX76_13040 [Planctomycetota bacterium]
MDPAGDATPAWVVRNPFGTEIEDVVVVMTTTDFEGAVDTESVTVSVPARGQTRVPLPESMWRDVMSMYYVEAQLSRNGKAGAQGEGKFTTLTPTGLADQDADYEFRFGINHVHDGHAARAAAMIGAMDARFDFTFPGIFRESGEIDWNFAGRDTGFDEVLAEGLNIHPLIGYNTYHNAPDGAKPTGFHEDWGTWIFTYPLDLEAYRQKVRQWAERYASRVTWVEPWNEPGWMGVNKARREWYDNERYIEILRIVNEEIKRVNPEIQINTGGFANTHDPMDLHKYVLEHGRDYFDVHINHAHGHFNHIRKEVAAIKEMREKNGITDRPLYFNETSTSHIFPTAAMEKHVAGHLVRTAVYLWANGVAGHLWFEIDDIGWIDRDDYNRWGMWTENWEPKAVVPAYNTLTSRIRGARFVERFETVEDQYIYLFERGEAGQDGHEWILSTWRHGQKTADEVFGLRIPEGSQATTYNLVGTRRDVVAEGNVVPLSVNKTPGWMVIRHAPSPPTLEDAMISFTGSIIVDPDDLDGSQLAIRVTNPRDTPQAVSVRTFAPNGTTADHELTLSARGHASVPLSFAGHTAEELKPIDKKNNDTFNTAEYAISYRLGDTGWSGQLVTPFVAARVIEGTRYNRPADFVLDRNEQVKNRFSFMLNSDQLQWKGPDDLSAEFWIDRVGENIRFRVRVTDDTHLQPYHGYDAWKGDSIQIGVAGLGDLKPFVIGAGRTNDGRTRVLNWGRPDGVENIERYMEHHVQPSDRGMDYEIVVPFKKLGLTRNQLFAEGFGVSLAVNDLDIPTDDFEQREGFIMSSSGVADGVRPQLYPLVRFKR